MMDKIEKIGREIKGIFALGTGGLPQVVPRF